MHPGASKQSSDGFKLELIRQSNLRGVVKLQANYSIPGFIINLYDPVTMQFIGTFDSPFPQYTGNANACGDTMASSLGHIANPINFDFSGAKALAAPFSLPADYTLARRVEAFAVVIRDMKRYVMVSSEAAAAPIVAPANPCPSITGVSPNISPGAVVIGFSPVVILSAVGLLLQAKALGSLRASLDTTLLGSKLVSPVWLSSVNEAGFWLRTVTVDVLRATCTASVGETLAGFLFYATQAVALGLYWIRLRETGMPEGTRMARALGRLLQINLSLSLFLPTRNSLWNRLLGISFERCIKYHRIVSRTTIILVLAHGALWISKSGWTSVTSSDATCFGSGNLWGFISGVLFLVMAIGSWELVRRLQYELFHVTHTLAPVALGFACAHAHDTIWFLIVPLLLYLVDHVLRVKQRAGGAKVASALALPGLVTRLEIHSPAAVKTILDKGAEGIGSFVMLHVSGVSSSPVDLHPFTVSGISAATGVLSVHARSQGPGTFTGQLHAAVLKGAELKVQVEGPYGHIGMDLANYTTLVSVAGGIGITPSGRLLEIALEEETRKALLPQLRRLILIWVVQDEEHLKWFEQLLARCTASSADPESNPSKTPEFAVERFLYVTKKKGPEAPAQEEQEGAKEVQQVALPHSSGRPQIGTLFKQVEEGLTATESALPGKGVAVLSCGPVKLQHEVFVESERMKFHVHAETFEL